MEEAAKSAMVRCMDHSCFVYLFRFPALFALFFFSFIIFYFFDRMQIRSDGEGIDIAALARLCSSFHCLKALGGFFTAKTGEASFSTEFKGPVDITERFQRCIKTSFGDRCLTLQVLNSCKALVQLAFTVRTTPSGCFSQRLVHKTKQNKQSNKETTEHTRAQRSFSVSLLFALLSTPPVSSRLSTLFSLLPSLSLFLFCIFSVCFVQKF